MIGTLKYPADLNDAFVTLFSCVDIESNTSIPYNVVLPMPNAGLAFSDGGQYSEVNLGTTGAIAEAFAGGSGLNKLGSTIKETGVKNILLNAPMVTQEMRLIGGSKAITNPNTNTTFSGNTIRSFTFAYKLSPRNVSEANTIKKIDSTFRSLVYASNKGQAAKLYLHFPPVWKIAFLLNQRDLSTENPNLPKIADCYLTSYTSNFNPSGNVYHEDGNPTEIDINLSFQETRVLTREDLNILNSREFDSSETTNR